MFIYDFDCKKEFKKYFIQNNASNVIEISNNYINIKKREKNSIKSNYY